MAPPIVVPAAILGPSPDLAAAVDHGLLDEYMHRKKKVLFTVDIDEDADSKKSEPEGSQPTEIEKPEEDVPPPPEDPLAAEVEDLLDLDEDEEEEDEEDEEYEGEDIDGKKVYDLEFLFSKREAGSSAPVGLVLKSDIYSKSAKSEAFYLKWKETFEKQGARASSHRGTRRHESKYGSGRGGGGGGRSKRREDRHAVKDKRPGKQLKIVKRTVPKDEIEILKRKANAILNKLTIDKFESLSKQFFDLVSEACTDCQRAQIIVRLIFDKVVYQKHFADMYTLLCSRFNSRFTEFPMEQIDPETGAVTVKKYSFRHILLSQCQREFVAGIKELTAEDVPDPAEREEKKILQKSRWLGNTIFIGKLYMQNLIHESIIIKCIDILWSNPQDEDYEAVCSLLATVGKKIDASPSENIKKAMTGTFDRIVKTIHENKVIPRIRFALMDLVELRTNMWVPRRMKESAKALSEIHKTSDAKPSTPTSRVDPFANKSFKSTSTAAVAPSSTPGPAPAPSIVETKPASVAQGKFVGKIEEGKLKTAVKEYVESSDKEELKLLFRDLEEKDGFDRQAVRSCFVRMFIEIGVISKTAEYHRILAGTFESLASSEIFSVSEVKSGVEKFLEFLEDFSEDAPKAPKFIFDVLFHLYLKSLITFSDLVTYFKSTDSFRWKSIRNSLFSQALQCAALKSNILFDLPVFLEVSNVASLLEWFEKNPTECVHFNHADLATFVSQLASKPMMKTVETLRASQSLLTNSLISRSILEAVLSQPAGAAQKKTLNRLVSALGSTISGIPANVWLMQLHLAAAGMKKPDLVVPGKALLVECKLVAPAGVSAWDKVSRNFLP